MFLFVSNVFVIAHLESFYNCFFKSLSENSDISVTLVLVSIDCLFFIQFEIFLILGMMSDFQLKPGCL